MRAPALALVTGLVALATSAAGQLTRPTAIQQNELQLAALAGARSEVYQRIRELPVSPTQTIGDLLSRDLSFDRAVRLWVRGRPHQGAFRLYSDNVCEADVRLEPADLADQFGKLLESFPAAAPPGVTAATLASAARNWPILWSTGRIALGRPSRTAQPPGWEDVSSDGLDEARAAAAADAFSALLTEVARLKITATRRVREFLESSPQVREAVEAEIRRTVKAAVEHEPDQVAVARMRLSVRELVQILTRVHQERYQGTDFSAGDFREMAVLAGDQELTAAGLATPPSDALLRGRYKALEYNAPEWAGRSLSAAGRYEPADGDTQDAAARQEAARLDAIERLYHALERLVIQEQVTVADYLAYHQDLKDDVTLLLTSARLTAPAVVHKDGVVEVKVELPLRRLWEIVRRKMRIEEVEPSARGGAAAGSISGEDR
ncbi:MAG: hypothetical protein AB1716_11835 [Planctomycetota bacterium]